MSDKNSQPFPEQAQSMKPEITGETSDGFHTFNELYDFRKAYNAALFNDLAASGKCSVHKSWRHHDGELCFGGGWFIVVAILPDGQISNHYRATDWDLFRVPETDKALFEFDGHTSADVISRLKSYATRPPSDDSEKSQAVLIQGKAYTVPMAVACELVNLHMQLMAANSPAPAQQSEKTGQAECKSCKGMGFVDGTGEACLSCSGQGVSPLPQAVEPVWLFPDHTWTSSRAMAVDHGPCIAAYPSPTQQQAAEPVTLLVSPEPAALRQPEMWRVRLPDWVYPGGWEQMPRTPNQQAEFEYWRSQDGAVIEYAVVIQDMTSAHPQADAHKSQGLILHGGRDKLTGASIPDTRSFGDLEVTMTKGATQPQAAKPVLWAIFSPGPNEYHSAPSKEIAEHMMLKTNAELTDWYQKNPDTSGMRPTLESIKTSVAQWPGGAAYHADEVAAFDYAAWGLTPPAASKPLTEVVPVSLVDGSWYWVRYEGLGQTYEAPALYKDDAKAFYSFDFSGIPRLEVEVLCLCVPTKQALEAKPLFWYRPRSDGCYEGPIHNSSIEEVRKKSGAWVPLVPLITTGSQS